MIVLFLRECEVREKMRLLLRLFLTGMGSFSTLVGLSVLQPPLAVAPPIKTPYSELPQLPSIQTIEDLYQMRDRLQTELAEPASTPTLSAGGTFSTPTKLLQMLQAVEIRIQVEEAAQKSWDRAIQMSIRAQETTTNANLREDTSFETLGAIRGLWQQAVNFLEAVPEGSLIEATAAKKMDEYQSYLKSAAYQYDNARSRFLQSIVQDAGLSLDSVHITVCNLDGECRRWLGASPPANPASLIKVPVAIALMQKLAAENIDINTKIIVDSGNYTEDASDIWVGSQYTLRYLLLRMINQSSNIATNQLIDYIGQDQINQILRDRGYTATSVNTKLVGDQIYPANTGVGANEIDTDDLTEMMRQIFRQDHPGDDLIIEALASQHDTDLGFEGLRSTPAIWLGEKTGQNSKVLGATLALKIKNQDYVMSVAIDNSGDEIAMRQCIRDIANHIAKAGRL
jgi:beta-lactamase class A